MKMNDRYLFRGRRYDNGEWITGWITSQFKKCTDGEVLTYIKSNVFGGGEHLVNTETVGQCTGLKDKNGKLIFEGDIFRYKYEYDYQPTYGVVYYQNDYDQYRRHNPCGYVIKWQGITRTAEELRMDLPFWCGTKSNAEVCGNIHDNPEFLEVEE